MTEKKRVLLIQKTICAQCNNDLPTQIELSGSGKYPLWRIGFVCQCGQQFNLCAMPGENFYWRVESTFIPDMLI